jgi:hypothetical protein
MIRALFQGMISERLVTHLAEVLFLAVYEEEDTYFRESHGRFQKIEFEI